MKHFLRKLKRVLIVFLVAIAIFLLYVEIVNRNSKQMTYRQKILKAVYPAFMWFNKITGKKSSVKKNESAAKPPQSIYDLSVTLNSGRSLPLDSLKGKKILLVNTASNCGYTNQYDDLEKLYEKKQDKLVIIAFPANDFKEQEKGTDEEIAQFCKINYGVTFPLAKKSQVIKGQGQNPVFQWLTDKNKNGWSNQAPTWNFSKFLVNEEGALINYFDPAVSPLSDEVINAIE